MHFITLLCKSRFALVTPILLFREGVVLLKALKITPQMVSFIQQQKIITNRHTLQQYPMSIKQFAMGLTYQGWCLPEPGSACLEFFYGKALLQGAPFPLRLLQERSVERSTQSTATSFETSSSRTSYLIGQLQRQTVSQLQYWLWASGAVY